MFPDGFELIFVVNYISKCFAANLFFLLKPISVIGFMNNVIIAYCILASLNNSV